MSISRVSSAFEERKGAASSNPVSDVPCFQCCPIILVFLSPIPAARNDEKTLQRDVDAVHLLVTYHQCLMFWTDIAFRSIQVWETRYTCSENYDLQENRSASSRKSEVSRRTKTRM
jgi:hypothetical protein